VREAGDSPRNCGHHGCLHTATEKPLTTATVVTFLRTAAALAVALHGAQIQSLAWLVVALLIYWAGDIADGMIARLTDSETRAGAVLDIICDRLCALTIYVSLAWIYPDLSLAIGIYVFQFTVIDGFLSLAFLAWPLSSPNYFYRVDRLIWRWNWSLWGKALNSALFALLLIWTQSLALGVVVAGGLAVLKVWSLVRLVRLGVPHPVGCAAQVSSPAVPTGAPSTDAPT
jgi:CDP-diacylglycerol---glycerol-3-phosphate 3-phosphatidyltransferase